MWHHPIFHQCGSWHSLGHHLCCLVGWYSSCCSWRQCHLSTGKFLGLPGHSDQSNSPHYQSMRLWSHLPLGWQWKQAQPHHIHINTWLLPIQWLQQRTYSISSQRVTIQIHKCRNWWCLMVLFLLQLWLMSLMFLDDLKKIKNKQKTTSKKWEKNGRRSQHLKKNENDPKFVLKMKTT